MSLILALISITCFDRLVTRTLTHTSPPTLISGFSILREIANGCCVGSDAKAIHAQHAMRMLINRTRIIPPDSFNCTTLWRRRSNWGSLYSPDYPRLG